MIWAELSYNKYSYESMQDRLYAEDYNYNYYEDHNCGYTIIEIEDEEEMEN